MHILQKPIRRNLAPATRRLSFLVGQRADGGELQAHSDRIDKGRHCAWPRPLDHSSRKLAEVRLLGQVDLIWPLAGTGSCDLAGQGLLRIMIQDRILALADDIVCRPVEPRMNDDERAIAKNAV